MIRWKIEAENEVSVFTRQGEVKESEEVHIHVPLGPCTVRSVKAEMDVAADENTRIYMNGYQTWTACPEYTVHSKIRGLDHLPKPVLNQYSFDRYGDYHFVKYPNKEGITHGFSWCTFRDGEKVRMFASLDEKPGYTMFLYNAKEGKLYLERDCAGLVCEDELHAFDLLIREGSENEVYDTWFERMNVHPLTDQKLYGYSSWYNRYQNIDEASILQDLSGCSRIFEEGDMFQIDDGWEPFVGDWLTTDSAKFPNGLKDIVDKIHNSGFKAGLWLAPFAAEENSQLYKEHPDWFYTVEGKPWKNGCNWSGFYSLDIDNPEVIAYLEKVFARVFDEWGFDLVKLDFLYAAAPFGNDKETRAARMIRTMDLLRLWCKDKQILGCGVPVVPAFGKVEYCRISCDVSLDWDDKAYMRLMHRERTSTKQAIGNIVSRAPLNGRAYLSDPDVFFLRKDNISLTEKEKEDLITLDALAGGVYMTSDDPSSYSDEMIELYKRGRELTNAKLLEVRADDCVHVRYEEEGEEKTADLFTESSL